MNKLEVSQEDHLRETIAHTHTDLRVALMMLRTRHWSHQGGNMKNNPWGPPCGDEEGTDDE